MLTLIDIFKRSSILFKANIALRNRDYCLTYEQLDELTTLLGNSIINQIGDAYRSEGIPLLFSNRFSCILAIIAVLKVGKTYIPVDLNYPGELIQHILSDTDNTIFISDDTHAVMEKLGVKGKQLKGISFNDLYHHKDGMLQPPRFKSDIACIMYTSGSSGKPKGVRVTQQAIISRTYQPKYISLTEQDVFLSHSNLAFDASSFEIWGALLNGGTLICIDQQTDILDYKRFEDLLIANHVTILWQTTSLFNHYVRYNYSYIYDSLRFLLIGGEALNKKLLKRYLLSSSRKCIVLNGYGPTENCIFSTTHKFSSADDINESYKNVTIGSPIDHTDIAIVNEQNELVLIEEVGELLLGGLGLANGYLNNEQLTEDKFIKYQVGDQENLYYRSGDLGFYGRDGLIYYVDRKDTQIKIRGFRIELEEIVDAFLSFNAIDEVVIKPFFEEDTFLVAYFTTFDQNITFEKIKIQLCKKLPSHMIPKFFVILPTFPRTENQKIAASKLPHPIGSPGLLLPSNKTGDNPRSLEQQLAKIWENILGHHAFNSESNFFDVGGDSLKVMALLSELNTQFKKQINIIDLFKSTNISSIVKNILI